MLPVVFCFGEITSENTIGFHCTDMYNISNSVVFIALTCTISATLLFSGMFFDAYLDHKMMNSHI